MWTMFDDRRLCSFEMLLKLQIPTLQDFMARLGIAPAQRAYLQRRLDGNRLKVQPIHAEIRPLFELPSKQFQ